MNNELESGLERLLRLQKQVEMAIEMVKNHRTYEVSGEGYDQPLPANRMDVGDFIIIDRLSSPHFGEGEWLKPTVCQHHWIPVFLSGMSEPESHYCQKCSSTTKSPRHKP